MEEDLRWKTTFEGWQPLMEDHLLWKTTCNGRWPSMEDGLWWKTTFDGIRPLIEDNLWWKTAFNRRWLLIESALKLTATPLLEPRREQMESSLLYLDFLQKCILELCQTKFYQKQYYSKIFFTVLLFLFKTCKHFLNRPGKLFKNHCADVTKNGSRYLSNYKYVYGGIPLIAWFASSYKIFQIFLGP